MEKASMKNQTRAVFLDMDGVLNNDEFIMDWIAKHGDSDASLAEFKKRYYRHNNVDGYLVPQLLGTFIWLCDETDCRIVWSSSWRQDFWKPDIDTGEFHFDMHGVRRFWKAKGLPVERLIGCTPCENLSRFSYVPRGVEIQMWLDENATRYNIGNVAILDDLEEAFYGVKYERARFFQTEFQFGLTDDIANATVSWLQND